MTDSAPHDDPSDPAADTGRFQAFVDGQAEPAVAPSAPRSGVPFRLVTLLAGLVVLGVLVWLLFLL